MLGSPKLYLEGMRILRFQLLASTLGVIPGLFKGLKILKVLQGLVFGCGRGLCKGPGKGE